MKYLVRKIFIFETIASRNLAKIQELLSGFLFDNHIHPDKPTMNAEFAPQYEEFEGFPFSDVKEGV